MTYPTLEEVGVADREQICCWYRFLLSPGSSGVGSTKFCHIREREGIILDAIVLKYHELGGMTPLISKKINLRTE